MHGQRLRMHRREQHERIRTCESLQDLCILKASVSGLLKAEMEIWDAVFEYIEGEEDIEGGDNVLCDAMAKHFLQWCARRAKALHEELEALIRGRDPYNQLVCSVYQIYSS